jgi:hypothetical protein
MKLPPLKKLDANWYGKRRLLLSRRLKGSEAATKRHEIAVIPEQQRMQQKKLKNRNLPVNDR